MKISFLSTIALLGFSLAAHAGITGTLTVKSPTYVHIQQDTDCRDADPRPGCLGPFEFYLKTGPEAVSVDLDSNSMTLNLDGYYNYAQVVVNGPMPASGDFHFTSAQTGQDWSMSGHIADTQSNGPEQSGYESCTYTRQVWECEPNGEGCHYETETYPGQRFVRYYNHSEDINLTFVLQGSIAKYDGRQDTTETIYTYQGDCE